MTPIQTDVDKMTRKERLGVMKAEIARVLKLRTEAIEKEFRQIAFKKQISAEIRLARRVEDFVANNNLDPPPTPPRVLKEARRLEEERQAKLLADKLAAEQAVKDKLLAEQQAAEQAEKDRLLAEQLAAEKLLAEQKAAEQAEKDKLQAEKMAAAKLLSEQKAAELARQ